MIRDRLIKYITLVRSSLVLNSYIIMLTRMVGSVAGYVFWVLAARLVIPGSVGLASSAIAAALLIANLSQLGYGYGLVRFLPHAERPSEMICRALVTSSGASLLMSAAFLALIRTLSPDLAALRADALTLLSFSMLTVSTSITQVLHWVFFARRKFNYTLAGTVIQTVLSVSLLVILPRLMDGFRPIIWAYTLSSALALAVLVIFFLRRAEPAFRICLALPRLAKTPLTGYLLSSFVAEQFQKGLHNILPLLVLNVLGAEANAYFYMSWSIVSGLLNLIGGVSASLFAEGSNRPEKAHAYTVTTLKMGALYALGTVLVVSVFSRLILSLYGSAYVTHAASLFLVLLASIIPSVIINILITFLRIRASAGHLVLYVGLFFAVGLAATFAGMRLLGLMGIGYGWITAQLIMVGVGIALWKYLERTMPQAVAAPAPSAEVGDVV